MLNANFEMYNLIKVLSLDDVDSNCWCSVSLPRGAVGWSAVCDCGQGSHNLEKYLNLEGFLEKSLKIKPTLKSTGKSLKSLEKSLNSTVFCRTLHCR